MAVDFILYPLLDSLTTPRILYNLRAAQKMDVQQSDERALPPNKDDESQHSQFTVVANAFLELLELLEEYCPPWYTEQHRNRALAARRVLEKS